MLTPAGRKKQLVDPYCHRRLSLAIGARNLKNANVFFIFLLWKTKKPKPFKNSDLRELFFTTSAKVGFKSYCRERTNSNSKGWRATVMPKYQTQSFAVSQNKL
jgi:hypothetical protein